MPSIPTDPTPAPVYVGGHVRPKNEKAKRIDRRLAENRTGKGMATLRADQHPAYDELGGLNEIARNNHGRAFVVEADFSTNQAESFFSRVRRGETGIFHRMAGKDLDWYAADLAWREDRRRQRVFDLQRERLLMPELAGLALRLAANASPKSAAAIAALPTPVRSYFPDARGRPMMIPLGRALIAEANNGKGASWRGSLDLKDEAAVSVVLEYTASKPRSEV